MSEYTNTRLKKEVITNILRPLKHEGSLGKNYSEIIQKLYKEWKEFTIIKSGK